MKKLLFLDTETTGLQPTDRLCQLAYKIRKADGESLDEPECALFRPPVPISFEAMAVTHITNEMVAEKESFAESATKKLLEDFNDCVLVAHNAPFDASMLAREGLNFPVYIDTLRVARHLIDLPQHNLQYLRYALDLRVHGTAHSAQGDVNVLVALFDHLLAIVMLRQVREQEEKMTVVQAVDQMITLTNLPVLLKSFTFGKYIGKTFEEVAKLDRQYLVWLRNSEMSKLPTEQNEDMLHTLKTYLK